MKACPRCRNRHYGSLIYASSGLRCILLSEWEQACSEKDLRFQVVNQLPLIKPPANLARFIELTNGF